MIMWNKDQFKRVHSDLIMHVQVIENDLRVIYAAMRRGNFDRNFEILETANLGKIIRELKELDYSNGHPDLSKEDYKLLNEIKEIRNYWCHQCYIDYVFISDYYEREQRFREISERLYEDERQMHILSDKIDDLKIRKLEEYNRL